MSKFPLERPTLDWSHMCDVDELEGSSSAVTTSREPLKNATVYDAGPRVHRSRQRRLLEAPPSGSHKNATASDAGLRGHGHRQRQTQVVSLSDSPTDLVLDDVATKSRRPQQHQPQEVQASQDTVILDSRSTVQKPSWQDWLCQELRRILSSNNERGPVPAKGRPLYSSVWAILILPCFVIGWYWHTKTKTTFDPSQMLFGLEEVDACRGNISAHEPFLGDSEPLARSQYASGYQRISSKLSSCRFDALRTSSYMGTTVVEKMKASVAAEECRPVLKPKIVKAHTRADRIADCFGEAVADLEITWSQMDSARANNSLRLNETAIEWKKTPGKTNKRTKELADKLQRYRETSAAFASEATFINNTIASISGEQWRWAQIRNDLYEIERRVDGPKKDQAASSAPNMTGRDICDIQYIDKLFVEAVFRGIGAGPEARTFAEAFRLRYGVEAFC